MIIHFAFLLAFHYVNVPFTNMRETADETSEVLTQGYYSEQVKIVEEDGEYVKIETTVDHHQGWTKKDHIVFKEKDFYEDMSAIARVNRCMAHLYHVSDTIYGPIITLPFEGALQVVDDTDFRWIEVLTVDEKKAFIQRGDILLKQKLIPRDQIVAFSKRFLGLPYTWGGRSSFGYDCSGFVQMLYRQMGINIPRNSKEQIKWEGFSSIEIKDMKPGDLIFFGSTKDSVSHVGMYIGSDQFIHATIAEDEPYIHISNVSDPYWNGSGEWAYRAARTYK